MKTLFAAVLATFVVALSATPASATSISIAACYAGSCGSLTGQIDITITDDNGPNENVGSVDDLKVVIQNNTNGYIDEIGLFYSAGLPANTTIEGFSGTGGTGAPTLSFGLCPNDNSGQTLNVCFDFPTPNASRFDAGDTATFFLDSDTIALLSASFSSSLGYAHIQEIGGGQDSAKITSTQVQQVVPEPASLLLVGSASALLATRLRRRRKA